MYFHFSSNSFSREVAKQKPLPSVLSPGQRLCTWHLLPGSRTQQVPLPCGYLQPTGMGLVITLGMQGVGGRN